MTDTTDVLTEDEALRLLREVVVESGESHVDPVCNYASPCIVGAVFAKRGVDNDTLRRWDKAETTDGSTDVRSLFVDGFLPPITEDAARVLRRAQTVQDRGRTWGEALAEAEDFAVVAKA